MSDKFLIIDGSSLIHRAFFALPPLMTKQGVPTGAVYGLCNMLQRLITELQPRYMAVAFDKSRKTFRTRLYADYKGQRKPTPPELSTQFPLAIKVLELLGIATLELDDYEADDIIGTLALEAPPELQVVIVTGDRDELQLIDGRTQVYYTKRGISDIQIFDEAEFAKVYEGLVPKQLIELKGLMGDSSDNIPGVPGVGPKTALKLIKEYGSVETVLEHIDAVAGKSLKQKLNDNKESALLSKQLATICTAAPVATEMAGYELGPMHEEAQSLLAELEFRSMYERFATLLGGGEPQSFGLFGEVVVQESAPVRSISSAEEGAELFALLNAAQEPVPVLATVAGTMPELYFSRVELLCEGTVYVLEGDCGCWQQFDAWLERADRLKQTYYSKELYKCCLCRGLQAQGVVDDVALAAYVADPGHSSYQLEDLQRRYLSSTPATGCETLALLLPEMRQRLAEHEQVELYKDLELPLAAVLAQLEYNGIQPDKELLLQLSEDMRHRIARLEQRAQEQAGEPFNPKSPKQLGVVLFERLQLPVIKKTKTGYSTNVEVLEALADKHPLVGTILEYRKLTKLQSTYLEGLQPLINVKTGRIHTHFQQTVAVTGRLSSSDPNLQNIPVRTEEGREIRRVFVPGAGYDYLLSCDYSQIELRVLACLAQDELLLESFRQGQDVHARTASEVFGVPLAEVTREMRGHAKAVNFGIVYGMSDYGLAKQLNVSREEAQSYINSYFARYTGVKKYMESIVAQAREQGYVSTLMGRRRYLPDIRSSNFNLRSFAERTAINTPVQGTAADIMKQAMLDVAAALAASDLHSRILLHVHDELVLEVTEIEREQTAELVQQTMQAAVQLAIPLLAEVKFGRNWAEAK